MKRDRAIQWLYEELPELEAQGVLGSAETRRIRAHYGEVQGGSRRTIILTLFGILGAILIGSGIILIVGHNWEQLGRPARTVLSLSPLVAAQILAAAVLWYRPASRPWQEGSAAFLTLTIAASIGLIGQTYHIPGDLLSFLITWMLLTLPIAYLFQSALVLACYLVQVIWWLGHQNAITGEELWYWLLLALAIPYLIVAHRKRPFAPGTALIGLVACISLTIAGAMTADRAIDGLWCILFAAMFAAMYTLGAAGSESGVGLWRQPVFSYGLFGTGIFSLVLSYRDVWDSITREYTRGFEQLGGYHDLATLALITLSLACIAASLRQGFVKRGPSVLLVAASPLLAALSYAVCTSLESPVPGAVVYNGYALILSVAAIVFGVQRDSLTHVNLGLLLFSALAMLRFFDANMGFVLRGVLFIAIGIAFLTANAVMVRRRSESA